MSPLLFVNDAGRERRSPMARKINLADRLRAAGYDVQTPVPEFTPCDWNLTLFPELRPSSWSRTPCSRQASLMIDGFPYCGDHGKALLAMRTDHSAP